MCECCEGKAWAIKLLVLGIILIAVRLYKPSWDIWVVIGVLAIIKSIIIFVLPMLGKKKVDITLKKKR